MASSSCGQSCGVDKTTVSKNLKNSTKKDSAKSLHLLDIKEDEKRRLNQMQYIDNAHAIANSLDDAGIEKLFSSIEMKINDFLTYPCSIHAMKLCFDVNADCPMKCEKEVTEFINCLDDTRFQILKLQMSQLKKMN